MKLTFENLGPLEQGGLELAELTVLCGQNNSGKTYLTYALYCLLKAWAGLTKINLADEIKTLSLKGVVQIDIDAKIIAQWPAIKKNLLDEFIENLPTWMAAQSALFTDTKLDFTFSFGDNWKQQERKIPFSNADGQLLLTVTKPAKSHFATITAANPSKELLSSDSFNDFLSAAIVDIVFAGIIPDVFMASNERTGAVIFRRDLDLARMNRSDLWQTFRSHRATIAQTEKSLGLLSAENYARPIDDNVRYANALPGTDMDIGSLAKDHPDLLASFATIAGGQYVTNPDGVTYFQPTNTTIKLALGETSSAVRSLLVIWYWLKYQARTGSMLMIDEPELNLHPDNQRRLARFLVRLVNLGVRVFITTHSDYIIREFNTLIMLNQDISGLQSVREKFRDYSHDDKLAAGKVALYYTGEENILKEGAKRKSKTKTLLRANISQTLGIEAKTFDATIDAMNAIQEAIYYAAN